MSLTVDIIVKSIHWEAYDATYRQSENILRKVCEHFAIEKADIEVALMLVDNKEMRTLNKNYRDKDVPTNVLAFPVESYIPFQWDLGDASFTIPLGDIVMNIDAVIKESTVKKLPFDWHFTHLLIHSFLHLLGFDHLEEKDAAIMEAQEVVCLRYFAIDDPYKITDI